MGIFRVRNGFYLVFSRNQDWNGVFLMFLTFFEQFLVGKVMKENLLRKVRKSEKRNSYFYIEKWTFKIMCEVCYRAKRDKKEAT